MVHPHGSWRIRQEDGGNSKPGTMSPANEMTSRRTAGDMARF